MKKKTTRGVARSFYIPLEVIEAVDQRRIESGRTRNGEVVYLLRKILERENKRRR